MFEIVIDGVSYKLNFGMGFLRKIDKTIQSDVPNSPGVKKNEGLKYAVASLMDGELEALENVLLVANEGENPRLTTKILDAHIENPDTDIDALFEDVMGFLKVANATKKTVLFLQNLAEEMKNKQQ